MRAASSSPLLRPGLLDGVGVQAAPRSKLADACGALGATVTHVETDLLDEQATLAAVAGTEAAVLVVDAAVPFGAGGADALRVALDGAWSAVHARFAPEWEGKVVLVAPRASAGDHAVALRAGLENLARTLSIEWSRHGVRTTAILPGDESSDEEVAQVVAFLASSAGDYYSGCAFGMT